MRFGRGCSRSSRPPGSCPASIGPALSGVVAEQLHWRVVFLGLLPLIAIAGAMTVAAVAAVPGPADAAALEGNASAAVTSTASGGGPRRAGSRARPRRPHLRRAARRSRCSSRWDWCSAVPAFRSLTPPGTLRARARPARRGPAARRAHVRLLLRPTRTSRSCSRTGAASSAADRRDRPDRGDARLDGRGLDPGPLDRPDRRAPARHAPASRPSAIGIAATATVLSPAVPVAVAVADLGHRGARDGPGLLAPLARRASRGGRWGAGHPRPSGLQLSDIDRDDARRRRRPARSSRRATAWEPLRGWVSSSRSRSAPRSRSSVSSWHGGSGRGSGRAGDDDPGISPRCCLGG